MAEYVIAFFQYTIKAGEVFFHYLMIGLAALNFGFIPHLILLSIAFTVDNGFLFYGLTIAKKNEPPEEAKKATRLYWRVFLIKLAIATIVLYKISDGGSAETRVSLFLLFYYLYVAGLIISACHECFKTRSKRTDAT